MINDITGIDLGDTEAHFPTYNRQNLFGPQVGFGVPGVLGGWAGNEVYDYAKENGIPIPFPPISMDIPFDRTRNRPDNIDLYRGVPSNQLKIDLARIGVVVPLGWDILTTADEHNAGKIGMWTSWSQSFGVASYHANKGEQGKGVVLKKSFYRHDVRLRYPDDNFYELEVQVFGPVVADEIIRNYPNGNATAY